MVDMPLPYLITSGFKSKAMGFTLQWINSLTYNWEWQFWWNPFPPKKGGTSNPDNNHWNAKAIGVGRFLFSDRSLENFILGEVPYLKDLLEMILKNLPDMSQICWTDHRRRRLDQQHMGVSLTNLVFKQDHKPVFARIVHVVSARV